MSDRSFFEREPPYNVGSIDFPYGNAENSPLSNIQEQPASTNSTNTYPVAGEASSLLQNVQSYNLKHTISQNLGSLPSTVNNSFPSIPNIPSTSTHALEQGNGSNYTRITAPSYQNHASTDNRVFNGASTNVEPTRPQQAAKQKTRRTNASIQKQEYEDEYEDFVVQGLKTKSGRKVHRPAQYNPNEMVIRRKSRKVDPTSLCVECHRGHSPRSNRIVYCDGCNCAYHQLCHQPPIDDFVVQMEATQWYCSRCDAKRSKKPLETGATSQSLGLTEAQKKTYLGSLPIAHLVELVLFCENEKPELPIYNPRTREIIGEMRQQAIMNSERHQAALQDQLTAKLSDQIPEEPLKPPYTAEYVTSEGTLYPYSTLIRVAISNLTRPTKDLIFDYLKKNYPLAENFSDSATDALRWMVSKGQLVRSGLVYQLATSEPTHSTQRSLIPTFQQRRKVTPIIPSSFPTESLNSLAFTTIDSS